jgi:hypothetical protein
MTWRLPLFRATRSQLGRQLPEGPLDLFERPARFVGPESVPEHRHEVGASPGIRGEVAMADPPGSVVAGLDHVDEPPLWPRPSPTGENPGRAAAGR